MMNSSALKYTAAPLQPRILMLVPYEPQKDLRVLASIDLCAEVSWTEVAAMCHNIYHQQSRHYDGRVYRDLVNYTPYFGAQFGPPSNDRFPFEEGFSTLAPGLAQEVERALAAASDIVETLYFRGRTVSIPPRLLVCHGAEALLAGVRLKRRFGCPLIYDARHPWASGRPYASAAEVEALLWIERQLLPHTDRVLTSTPMTADLFVKLHDFHDAWPVLDAAPMAWRGPFSFERPRRERCRFLLQGEISPYDEGAVRQFVEQFCMLCHPLSTLVLCAPPSDLLTALTARFANHITRGMLEIHDEVGPDEMVEMATRADVSILPHGAPRVEYTKGCPRLLSMSMQAGTAIMYHQDQHFVAEVVDRYQCGRAYELVGDGLIDAVRYFSENVEMVNGLKRRAFEGARDWLCWDIQKAPYLRALEQPLEAGAAAR